MEIVDTKTVATEKVQSISVTTGIHEMANERWCSEELRAPGCSGEMDREEATSDIQQGVECMRCWAGGNLNW